MKPWFALSLLLCPLAQAQETRAPRLIVQLAIDQMIPEQFDRLESVLTGGLARIRKQGARIDGAHLPYAGTETGPGHATMATGCLPLHHGIVANGMRRSGSAETVYCVADPEARPVTMKGLGEPGGMSPKNLLRPSLGDYLKEHNPASIVASVSGKDRSAICLAGHHGDLALWWNPSGEGFQSCDTYVKELPAFVQEFNRGWAAGFAGQTWTPLFAADAAPPGTAADDREGEGSYPGDNRTFPHQALIPGEKEFTGELLTLLARQAEFGPQGDKLVLELAGLAVQNLNLGADDVTDLLGVSLSGVDKIGHIFGPYSVEVTDAILRLDRDLAVLFALLDERVGKDRWALALTADHGVLPLPESAEAKKLAPGAHRISAEEYRDLQKVLDRALGDAFGRDAKQRALRCHFFEGDLYFLDKELAERKIDVHEARRVAAAALKEVPWIVAAYTRDEVAGTEKGDPFLEAFRLSYRPDFSPDVLVVRQPGTLLAMTIGTTHGTPHPYDQRIPLYFLGPRFAPGNHAGPAGSHDIVPTLLDLVGLHPKGLDGRVLSQVFRP